MEFVEFNNYTQTGVEADNFHLRLRSQGKAGQAWKDITKQVWGRKGDMKQEHRPNQSTCWEPVIK